VLYVPNRSGITAVTASYSTALCALLLQKAFGTLIGSAGKSKVHQQQKEVVIA
jgi:hypothetical protein